MARPVLGVILVVLVLMAAAARGTRLRPVDSSAPWSGGTGTDSGERPAEDEHHDDSECAALPSLHHSLWIRPSDMP